MPTFTKTESIPVSQMEAGDNNDRNDQGTNILEVLEKLKRISISRCRKHLSPGSELSDEQVEEALDSLYALAHIALDGYDQQKRMITEQ